MNKEIKNKNLEEVNGGFGYRKDRREPYPAATSGGLYYEETTTYDGHGRDGRTEHSFPAVGIIDGVPKQE